MKELSGWKTYHFFALHKIEIHFPVRLHTHTYILSRADVPFSSKTLLLRTCGKRSVFLGLRWSIAITINPYRQKPTIKTEAGFKNNRKEDFSFITIEKRRETTRLKGSLLFFFFCGRGLRFEYKTPAMINTVINKTSAQGSKGIKKKKPA